MKETSDIFFEHQASLSNSKWNINLFYENSNGKSKEIKLDKDIKIIPVAESGIFNSLIKINIEDKETNVEKSFILVGIDGAFILYPKSNKENISLLKI